MGYVEFRNQVIQLKQEYKNMEDLISSETLEAIISKVTGIEPCVLDDNSVGIILKF